MALHVPHGGEKQRQADDSPPSVAQQSAQPLCVALQSGNSCLLCQPEAGVIGWLGVRRECCGAPARRRPRQPQVLSENDRVREVTSCRPVNTIAQAEPGCGPACPIDVQDGDVCPLQQQWPITEACYGRSPMVVQRPPGQSKQGQASLLALLIVAPLLLPSIGAAGSVGQTPLAPRPVASAPKRADSLFLTLTLPPQNPPHACYEYQVRSFLRWNGITHAVASRAPPGAPRCSARFASALQTSIKSYKRSVSSVCV